LPAGIFNFKTFTMSWSSLERQIQIVQREKKRKKRSEMAGQRVFNAIEVNKARGDRRSFYDRKAASTVFAEATGQPL
jgi:hypothetical protein